MSRRQSLTWVSWEDDETRGEPVYRSKFRLKTCDYDGRLLFLFVRV